jgi:YHS domain-containing protein
VIVDSFTGRVIAMHAGMQDRTAYSAFTSQAEARFYKTHVNDFAITKAIGNAGKSDVEKSVSSVKPVEPELGEPKPVIGMDGYSPVALSKNRKWTRGSSKFAWDHKDVTYYFSSREELVEFRNNPDSFAPKLLGCDPVILWESDKAVAGNIRYGAYFDNELFLFKSDERRLQFKSNPEKYIRLQHALKADQIEHTVIR